jgi:uncharacterized protein YkwD
VKRRVINILPLFVAVCLLALVAPTEAQQKKNATNTKTTTNTKTVSKNNVPQAATAKAETVPTATIALTTATAKNTGFMSQMEQDILDEMNLARADPQKYAGFVEGFKKYYDGNRLVIPGRKKALVTNEGVPAVDEAINFLRNQKTLPPLDVAKGLCLAAKDHANDLAAKGLSGHQGSDGSLPNTRVDRYGDWEGSIGETVVYEINPARQIVILLIIDDGTPNRGHRRNIFDPNYKVAGVSVVESQTNGARCVVDYVGSFKEKAASNR